MSVTIKSAREIELMKKAGEILAKTHDELETVLKPGISTYDINKIADEIIRSYGCVPSFLNYNGFPASICISLNDEVVHGIPSKKRIVKEGDIVSLDAGVIWKGYHSDAARTHAVGKVSDEAVKLIEVTRESFFKGIEFCKPGNHLNDICSAIREYAESFGYGVVRDLVGHGIGTKLHESPDIPNFRMNRNGIKLEPGMTFAIEPMINEGKADIFIDESNEWTVYTEDGSYSAQWEVTVAVTEDGYEVLAS